MDGHRGRALLRSILRADVPARRRRVLEDKRPEHAAVPSGGAGRPVVRDAVFGRGLAAAVHCGSHPRMDSRSEIRAKAPGRSRFRPARPFGITSPYSANRPRRPLICAVRNFTNCWRIRCSASTACCSSVFTATVLMPGCCTAIQIARASCASFLLPRTNARTDSPAESEPRGHSPVTDAPSAASRRTLPSRPDTACDWRSGSGTSRDYRRCCGAH